MLYLQESKLGWIVTGELGALLGESIKNNFKAVFADNDTYGSTSRENNTCQEKKML